MPKALHPLVALVLLSAPVFSQAPPPIWGTPNGEVLRGTGQSDYIDPLGGPDEVYDGPVNVAGLGSSDGKRDHISTVDNCVDRVTCGPEDVLQCDPDDIIRVVDNIGFPLWVGTFEEYLRVRQVGRWALDLVVWILFAGASPGEAIDVVRGEISGSRGALLAAVPLPTPEGVTVNLGDYSPAAEILTFDAEALLEGAPDWLPLHPNVDGAAWQTPEISASELLRLYDGVLRLLEHLSIVDLPVSG